MPTSTSTEPRSVHATGSEGTPHLYGGCEAALRLHILIIGCGLGGLAAAHCLSQAGHNITLIEAARRLGEVGAGIQVSPNVSRLLARWGLERTLEDAGVELEDAGVEPEAIVFRRYDNGEIVGRTRWGQKMRDEHGAPYYHVHRADFHKMVYSLAATSPRVALRLNSTVASVNPIPHAPGQQVSVTLTSGEEIRGDLIVGADGVKSLVRSVVIGRPDYAEPTGDAAYRAIISTDVLLEDPELRPFVETPEMTAWMGPGRHLMAYCMRGKKEYNLVMIHPDDGSIESWTAEGSAEKLRADFADYDPRIRKLLSCVQSTLKWRLMDRKPLETWVHSAGRVVLLGDSCHPMLPYRAQGAAMALEDAAVLGSLFSHLSHPAQITPLLRAYEKLRRTRTAKTQASSRMNQHVFHLFDGEEQMERDRAMREAMQIDLEAEERERRGVVGETGEENEKDGNPNQWADKKKNIEQFSYDADEAADVWWAEEGEELLNKVVVESGAV